MAAKQTQAQKNTIARQAARIALVQAERTRKNTIRREVATRQAFMAGVQQMAAQHGVAPEQVARMLGVTSRAARANSATVAPSRELVNVNGAGLKPCAAVHALCEQLVKTDPKATRADMLQLCKDNGINSATASTQVGIFRKKAAEAAEQAAADEGNAE